MDIGFNVGTGLPNKLHCEVVERLIVRLQKMITSHDLVTNTKFSLSLDHKTFLIRGGAWLEASFLYSHTLNKSHCKVHRCSCTYM